jgi:hypothetical protein
LKLKEVAVDELSNVPEKLTVWPGEAQTVLTLPGLATNETDCAMESALRRKKANGINSHRTPRR